MGRVPVAAGPVSPAVGRASSPSRPLLPGRIACFLLWRRSSPPFVSAAAAVQFFLFPESRLVVFFFPPSPSLLLLLLLAPPPPTLFFLLVFPLAVDHWVRPASPNRTRPLGTPLWSSPPIWESPVCPSPRARPLLHPCRSTAAASAAAASAAAAAADSSAGADEEGTAAWEGASCGGFDLTSGTSVGSGGRNVRQRKQFSVGKSANRAAGTRMNVADGAHGAAFGATAENGRNQEVAAVERINIGSSEADCSTAVISTLTPVSVRQQTLIINDCDYN
ncbi:hypothetical protein Taro_018102, partial [Colocasia esculenta]|nr:hypothetical protein [Colocasia esculenta]